ncbi:MAG: pilin [Candidatus Vogelbacteria bacterium]
MANKKNNWPKWGMTILFLVLINLPLFAFGQASDPNSANLVPCGQAGAIDCGYQEFLQLIVNVFDYLTKYIAIPLATATIVIGGVIMMTAGTNDSKRSEAKKIIWMAVWGLVIVLASWLIVKQVFSSLVDPNFTPDSFRD